MSKHNNNLSPSSAAKCKCGRYITLGEVQMGVNTFNYKCPDCLHQEYERLLKSI